MKGKTNMPASPDLAVIRNEAIKMAELYAKMEVQSGAICESARLIAEQLTRTAPMSDLEGALVEVIRRRPMPVHFEALSCSARVLSRIADNLIAAELAEEPDLPPVLSEEVPA